MHSLFRLTRLPQTKMIFSPLFLFATYPKHHVLTMPALSPTMTEGKILSWLKNEGDSVDIGDAICEIQTDKATMAFQVQEKGVLAKIVKGGETISIGTPVAIVAKNKEDAGKFTDYVFGGASSASSTSNASQDKATQPSQPVSTSAKKQQKISKAASNVSQTLPPHVLLKMPAVSPTMTEGKVLEWKIKIGDTFGVGDALFAIETDKATVDYQATEKGILANILVKNNEALLVGSPVAVFVKKSEDISKFANYNVSNADQELHPESPSVSSTTQQKKQESAVSTSNSSSTGGDRVIASPLAKTIAAEKGIDLSKVSGSGPGGRIIKQDVQSYVPPKKEVKIETTTASSPAKSETPKPTTKKPAFVAPNNPYTETEVSGMRKTVAKRLLESKTTIPHYYISNSIQMDALNALRTELNKNQKENGVKISVNDLIIKAVALALRDYPTVNSQWYGNVIRKYQNVDISVAVAIEGGLITPIVFGADKIGLLQIARRTKDVAKRAREGKLQPSEYIGGTGCVSNIGMFGVDSVASIINVPQSSIIGIGKTQKKILFDPNAPADRPYRVAEVMEVIGSFDHRVVDGAVGAQWISRVKNYLEQPTRMLL